MRLFPSLFLCLVLTFISCEKKETHKFTNALINESSPYLLQHAHNPVDWYAWDKKTIEKAKKENKLILLSIGYASCHWCHVMEDETFKDEMVAAFMNENFINIKIDREEHPNVDKVYLKAVQAMTGNSGWPLNCITLPNGEPVWGGTYFSKEEWLAALQQVATIYKENPQQTEAFAENIAKKLKDIQTLSVNSKQVFEKKVIDSMVIAWKEVFDMNNGGLQESQKFPRPNNYLFLLRYAHQQKDTTLLKFVNKTLKKISNRGLFDHVEGGFARYTTDAEWNVPHFEKMLYDNAQLVSLFSNAYQLTKDETYRNTVYETLDFIDKNLMRKKDGLLYSSLNADSYNKHHEMEEGAFYVWEIQQLKELFQEEYLLVADYYEIEKNLTEEGKHVLVKAYPDEVFAKKHKLTLSQLKEKTKHWKTIFLKNRAQRSAPEVDTKIITSWNALMLKAYTDAYKVFGEDSFKKKALQNANSIKTYLISDSWEVARSFHKQEISGYLEDYAFLIDAYISLYQITFEPQWLEYAKSLTEYTFPNFYDTNKKFFAYTTKSDQSLSFEELDIEDTVIPASNSVMSKNLFYLGHYFSNENYLETSKEMLQHIILEAQNAPYLYSNWLDLYLNHVQPYYEVVINGEEAEGKTKELQQTYLPNILLCGSKTASELPLLQNRYNEGKTYIYVCVNKACKLPTESVEKAISLMK